MYYTAHNDSKGDCRNTRHGTIQSFGWQECGSVNVALTLSIHVLFANMEFDLKVCDDGTLV
jgi:hypothetical protein